MAKVQIKPETIATYGGICHVIDVFERLGLGRLIDSSLGKRDASWNAFRYSEVIETLFCNYLCGGDCLEDINMLAPQLALRPGTRIPNSDTVGRVLKSLAAAPAPHSRTTSAPASSPEPSPAQPTVRDVHSPPPDEISSYGGHIFMSRISSVGGKGIV